MSGHFVDKCRYCNGVVTQCRCPVPDKTVRWTECEKCKQLRSLGIRL